VQLKPVTAWSCAHGVDRWQDDCGCGGGGGWHQKWRKPLRFALDRLRDRLIEVYETAATPLLRDPWQARDEYIDVILERSRPQIENFLVRHQRHSLSPAEQIDVLRLLEMQRHALLMYTSCGWFFEEISRPEGTQILRYAARALELAGDVTGIQLEADFVADLAMAPSNVEIFKTGAEVYRQLVVSAQVSFEQVAAHYAISSLFTHYPSQHQVYCYEAQQLDAQKQQIGSLTLSVGQIRLVSEITWESSHYIYAVLHLGGWDFHCCIQPFSGRRHYSQVKDQLFERLRQASATAMVVEMSQLFGNQSFDLQHLFAEERHRIMRQVTEKTKQRLDQLYLQVYRDNYGILVAFHRDNLPVPPELQVAADIALSHRCSLAIAHLDRETDDPQQRWNHLAELRAIAEEAQLLHCRLTLPDSKKTLERLILRTLWRLFYDPESSTVENDIDYITQLIALGSLLQLGLNLDRAQELYYNCLYQRLIPHCFEAIAERESCPWGKHQWVPLLILGQSLGVEVGTWLETLKPLGYSQFIF
jgi:alpha-amylase/alpha-mannosidase (GH57 family)